MKIVIAVLSALLTALVSRYYLHMLQLESYQLDGYVRWLKKNHSRQSGALTIGVGATAGYYALRLILRVFLSAAASEIAAGIIALAGFGLFAVLLDRAFHMQPEKKPLTYTPRMKRLYAALIVIALLAALMITLVFKLPGFIVFVAAPYLPLAAGACMKPVEKKISDHYLQDAKRKLDDRPDLIKIGITGSYGKTSTKFILATILSEKFDVLATPSSFNTPMGLTRVIREQLEKHHQVFLAEMGARHVGDIKELVELVHPRLGLLTSVGEQHLETFGDIETVASTKFELVEGLPENGAAFFAADGAWVDRLYERATCEKFLTGTQGMSLDMKAEDISVGAEGSSFTLSDKRTGEKIECRTKLLGRHNIGNITLACMVARYLGLTMEEIARGVSKLEPVEHRLQLLPGANGMTIIDDAFNSNPVGARAALDVLSAFEGRRRVVVTPGMVEQGEKEEEINRRFGAQMANKCDEAILVGKKHTQPIVEGLRAGGMTDEHIHVTASLDEATAVLGQIGRANDVVLFENDLPDNYNEK